MTLSDIVLKYNQKFDTGFPTAVYDENEAIKIMQECIKKGRDAYELGYLSDSEDIEY